MTWSGTHVNKYADIRLASLFSIHPRLTSGKDVLPVRDCQKH